MALKAVSATTKLMAQGAKWNAVYACNCAMGEIITAKKQNDNHFVHCKSI